MQLLLLLSALLTGMTGLIAGDRFVDARQVERSAVSAAAAVEAVSAATATSEEAAAEVMRAEHFAASAPLPRAADELPPHSDAPVDERRLE